MTFKEYFSQLITQSDREVKFALVARSFAKWWLETMRNALVTAALFTLAYKTQHPATKPLASITLTLFLAGVLSHVYSYNINLIAGARFHVFNKLLSIVIALIFLGGSGYFLFQAMLQFFSVVISNS